MIGEHLQGGKSSDSTDSYSTPELVSPHRRLEISWSEKQF
jgi:hypothetical protein